MAVESNPHPVYTSSTVSKWRLQSGRRFGKYDSEKFLPIRSSSHFLGKGEIGKVEVACKFLFEVSRWGVLTQRENPGGILYLDLVFTEPPGCYLRGATVILTLDEYDKGLQHIFPHSSNAKPKLLVHVTEHGLKKILGKPRTAEKSSTLSFMPTFSAGGFAEVGGVGHESSTRKIQESQWMFSSQALPDSSGQATTLRWDLSESDLERQPKHANTFHTAFAFQHDGQPFFIRLEVSGLLENSASNLLYRTKEKLKKFKFPGEPQRVTTAVNFGGRPNGYSLVLDELVKTITREMDHKNGVQTYQVQGPQTSQMQAQEFNAPVRLVEDEETCSHDTPISQATTNVPEEEMAEEKEAARTLIDFPKANSRAAPFPHIHIKDEKAPNTNESSQAAFVSENEPERPKINQTSTSLNSLQMISDLLKGMGIFPVVIQLIIGLVMLLRAGEKYVSAA
ncbi:hypothetical protein F5X97DRAFT_341916 [Nemania serpens]|nr:hypothetical protein F5X97DRAFT_341916 [Nemania serpens]